MSEGKDPAIKLFGRTIIQSPEISAPNADSRGVPPPPPSVVVHDDDAIPFSPDLPSSPNSSTENHSLGKRQEPDKVRTQFFSPYFLTIYFYDMILRATLQFAKEKVGRFKALIDKKNIEKNNNI